MHDSVVDTAALLTSGASLPALEHLNVSGVHVSDAGLQIILHHSKHLRILVARNCPKITGEFFSIAEYGDNKWSELVFLDLHKCSLRDEGIIDIARVCVIRQIQ